MAKQVLQTLGIIIQNVRSETGIFFLFSNNHVNNIVGIRFDFDDEEVLGYYISFLKAISLKLNPSTVQFFALEAASSAPVGGFTFPLYMEAIKFAHHKEGMVRAGVRTLTLNVFSVQDAQIQAFVCSHPANSYFSDVAVYMAEQFKVGAKGGRQAYRRAMQAGNASFGQRFDRTPRLLLRQSAALVDVGMLHGCSWACLTLGCVPMAALAPCRFWTPAWLQRRRMHSSRCCSWTLRLQRWRTCCPTAAMCCTQVGLVVGAVVVPAQQACMLGDHGSTAASLCTWLMLTHATSNTHHAGHAYIAHQLSQQLWSQLVGPYLLKPLLEAGQPGGHMGLSFHAPNHAACRGTA